MTLPVYQNIGADVGPLKDINIGVELSAQIRHTADSTFQVYPSDAVLGDIGTFLADLNNDVLYAPDFDEHSATGTGVMTGSYTVWSQDTQSEVHTAAGVSRVVTRVTILGADLVVTQTDTYQHGQNCWRTDICVENKSATTYSIILYRALDAYLHGSNNGYGAKRAGGIVGVAENANNDPVGNAIWIVPLVEGNYFEGTASDIWGAIKAQGALNDTIKTDSSHDAACGVSWSLTIPGFSSVVRSCLTMVQIAAPVVPPGAEPWRFIGHCYRGPDGDTSTPLGGVQLELWVLRTAPSDWWRKRTFSSHASGYWFFYEDQEFTKYRVQAVEPAGMAATGVSTGDGTIISDTVIEWTSPARGYHDGNKFFME